VENHAKARQIVALHVLCIAASFNLNTGHLEH